jgi:hypothetical protein
MSQKRKLFGAMAVIIPVVATPVLAAEDDWPAYLNKYMSEVVRLAASAPEVVAAIQEQNAAHAGLSPQQIEALDRQWRAERKVNGGPLTNGKMFNSTSQFLKGFKAAANGPIVEIFIMQVSTTIVDNDVAIGAMTVSIDLGKLPTE